MVHRVLVTTALEETWPSHDVPILFLGEWCRLHSRSAFWQNRDAVVANYHWDDRAKVRRDYAYLQNFYEELLPELAEKLNVIHGVDHSLKYWRILVGPWLGYLVQILFDRWSMIESALCESHLFGIKIVEHKNDDLVACDMNDFVQLLLEDDWNEMVYGRILEWKGVGVERISPKFKNKNQNRKDRSKPFFTNIKASLKKIIKDLSGSFSHAGDYVFYATYLDLKKDLKLQLQLGQIPALRTTGKMIPAIFDSKRREWNLSTSSDRNFIDFVRTEMSKYIPRVYLEGYKALISNAEELPWPSKPRAIFTSNAHISDEIFKAWAAGKVENNVPLVIGQHGGNYGTALWNFNEDHQLEIADYFLSWGWTSPQYENIKPIAALTAIGKQYIRQKNGHALMVELIIPRQSYHMWSAPIGAKQWLNYLDSQFMFVQALSPKLQQQLLVRLHSKDYGHNAKVRWQEQLPSIRLDDGLRSIVDLVCESRIYISTYNATTFLESMALNFPTLIFWDENNWEIRDDAVPFFAQLKAVGIFHETPESAAQYLETIWEDIDDWWDSDEIQLVRNTFCDQYARVPHHPIRDLRDFFLSIPLASSKTGNSSIER